MSESTPEKTTEPTIVLKSKAAYIWAAIALGWLFDLLFWEKVPGISIAIYLIVLALTGLVLARYQEITPAKSVYWLLIPLVFFSVMTFIRLEPLTTFLNVAASLLILGLIANSFIGGKWWQYRFKDYLSGGFFLGLDGFFRQVDVFSKQPKPDPEAEHAPPPRQGLKNSLLVLRGLLLALPIVLIFAAILAEADPIFEQAFDDFLDIFQIENIGEYIFRGIWISFLAYFLLGIFMHAFYKNHDAKLSDESSRLIPRFLKITDAAIVLGAVNLLFLVFVGIQFQYFFGGQSNINLAGYTYAEYARRGFGELVTVSVFSLLLFIGLSFLTKREGRGHQRLFSILGVVLMALVTVILVSSFQRLLLYEGSYGFTRLRTYTHLFIIWLGVLLFAVSLLELLGKQRFFALAVLTAGMGFVLTLNLLNVDAFITRQDFAQMGDTVTMDKDIPNESGEFSLDIPYLASLSEDAVPTLARLYAQADTALEKEVIAGTIACHAAVNGYYDYPNDEYRNYTLTSFHLSRSQAQADWLNRSSSKDGEKFQALTYEEEKDPGTWWDTYVIVAGEEIGCGGGYYGWD